MPTTFELTQFIKENDVKFIRLSFIDLDGRQKNLSVMAEELSRSISDGVPFSANAAGFDSGDDLTLVPDVSTIHILPWRPQHGRVARFLSFIRDGNGETAYFDSRSILTETVNELKREGITCNLGTDSEFYLFKTDDEGFPTKNTHDNAGYFDIAPLDKGENVRREICLCLEEMGIRPLSSHHERGPGQNEINFAATQALEACDNYTIFQSVVKAIASRNGLFASFMPKPLENKSGNGLALNVSLFKEKKPLFGSGEPSETARAFVAGILNRARETGMFFNSFPNSYERLGEFGAPGTAMLGKGSDSYMRIITRYGEKRLEFRSPDNACNLYLVVTLILRAGLCGIKNGEKIPEEPVQLPKSLSEAVEAAKGSEFLKNVLGERYLSDIVKRKTELAEEYENNRAVANQNAFERI